MASRSNLKVSRASIISWGLEKDWVSRGSVVAAETGMDDVQDVAAMTRPLKINNKDEALCTFNLLYLERFHPRGVCCMSWAHPA